MEKIALIQKLQACPCAPEGSGARLLATDLLHLGTQFSLRSTKQKTLTTSKGVISPCWKSLKFSGRGSGHQLQATVRSRDVAQPPRIGFYCAERVMFIIFLSYVFSVIYILLFLCFSFLNIYFMSYEHQITK